MYLHKNLDEEGVRMCIDWFHCLKHVGRMGHRQSKLWSRDVKRWYKIYARCDVAWEEWVHACIEIDQATQVAREANDWCSHELHSRRSFRWRHFYYCTYSMLSKERSDAIHTLDQSHNLSTPFCFLPLSFANHWTKHPHRHEKGIAEME